MLAPTREETRHDEHAASCRLRHGRRARHVARPERPGGARAQTQVRRGEVLWDRKGGPERLPDRELGVRRHVAPGRPEGRLDLRPRRHVRANGRRESSAAGVEETPGWAVAVTRQEAIPAAAGIGLRAPHVAEVIACRPPLPWLEVHAENYLGGGPAIAQLEAVRRDYPISLHGVGLSLGTDGAMDFGHLR